MDKYLINITENIYNNIKNKLNNSNVKPKLSIGINHDEYENYVGMLIIMML